MNFYEVLDLPRTATRDQVRAAYRIQVQLHHPDRLTQSNPAVRAYAEERLKLINEAYTTLYDPLRRSQYDATLRARETQFATVHPAPAYTHPPAHQSHPPDRHAYAGAAGRRKQTAAGQLLFLSLGRNLEMGCVRVPAGEFIFGSDVLKDRDAGDDESPQQRIYLSEFYIGQLPVSNTQYAAFVRATNAEPPRRWRNGLIPPGKERHPAVCISWDEAEAFCRWVGALNKVICRLPTEAEWEKAARGSDGRLYPWGNLWDATRLNSYESGLDHTTPVGQFSPAGDSPYGAADMCGNVQEWCVDWYDPTEYRRRRGVLRDPQGPRLGIARVIRGGSYEYYRELNRCACRNEAHPGRHVNNIGFRVAVVPGQRR